MVSSAPQKTNPSRRRRLWLAVILAAIGWTAAYPQAFVDLWLTPDQQGRALFQLGHYDLASRTFEDPRWRGFSFYAAEDFVTAERYFSQYQDADSLLARANALGHQMDYKAAKVAYTDLIERFPDNQAAITNLAVMNKLIEAIKDNSNTQAKGEGKSSKKQGEGSAPSESDEQQQGEDLKQYSADQLLQDPGLTEMWLRQIQRDPSEFLTTKFYLQLEKSEGEQP